MGALVDSTAFAPNVPEGCAEPMDVLLIVLVVVGIATGCVATWVMVRVDRAMSEARTLVKHLDERLIPLIEKVDVTVDAVNAELLRVDGIVSQFEEASDKVSNTARAAQDAVGVPMRVVAGAGEGLARFLSSFRRRA